MILQATLNGPLTKSDHAAVPVTAEELARDAHECAQAGADEFHIHSRDAAGAEKLDADTVERCVRLVRDATRLPVGVTTGAWIEPDFSRRLELIRAWRSPDYTSVNLSEPRSVEIIKALLQTGIGVEARHRHPHRLRGHVAATRWLARRKQCRTRASGTRRGRRTPDLTALAQPWAGSSRIVRPVAR